MTDSLQQRVFAVIGHQYAFEGELGRGGMSVVYRARDLRLGRQVAIKVLPPELAHDPAVRTRFAREAHTSAQLSHPNIVPIYDVGDREGIAYLVMALVTGGNLASLLARVPRPPIDEVRRLLCEVADALAYAHTRGVIHRDIKPDNILLDAETGRAMVTDFGIARAVEVGARLTVTGIAVGTPTYMSPEQAVGEREVDGRSDIYSLGVVAYQMVTGRVPFTAGNSMALLLKHVSERPRPIGELRPETPRAMREAIERAMAKSPDDRWPTATAMREALTAEPLPAGSWRAEPREPVRYTSPRPDPVRRERGPRDDLFLEPQVVAHRRATPGVDIRAAIPAVSPPVGGVTLVPGHLASLTPEQRQDLRLWRGYVHLPDRIKLMRRHAWFTGGLWVAASIGFITAFLEPDAFVLLPGPILPALMTRTFLQRARSLRAAGLRIRRVLLMPRAKWVLPAAPAAPTREALETLAPREVLESPYAAAIRQAADDQAAILHIVGKLSKADRALLPDVAPTVKALVERVATLAQMLHRLDQSFDPRLLEQVEARLTRLEQEPETPERERQLVLLRRQRDTLAEFAERHAALRRQLDNAGIALGNLRLDLLKVQSSGVQAALSDVSSATQEARALSREIGAVLGAAAEVRDL